MKILAKILTNDTIKIYPVDVKHYSMVGQQFSIRTEDYLKQLKYQSGNFTIIYYLVQDIQDTSPLFEQTLKVLMISKDLTQIKCKFNGTPNISKLQALDERIQTQDIKLLATNNEYTHPIVYLKYNFFSEVCVLKFEQPVSYEKNQNIYLHLLAYEPVEQKISLLPEQVQYEQGFEQIAQANVYRVGNMQSTQRYSLEDFLNQTGSTNNKYNPMLSIGNMLQRIHYDPYYPQNFVHFGSYKSRLDVFINKYIDIYQIQNKGIYGVSYTNSVNNIISGFNTFERHCFLDYGLTKVSDDNEYVIISMEPIESQTFTNWYSTKSANAIQYDRDNIHALTNFIPNIILYDERNFDLFAMVNMIGNTFDEYWASIRAIPSINGRLEGQLQTYSQLLLNDLLKNYGVDYRMGYANEGILETHTKFANPTTANLSFKQYDRIVKSRLVANMPFLLRSKGTRLAVEQILMCYGLSQSIIQIEQFNNDTIFKFDQFDTKFYNIHVQDNELQILDQSLKPLRASETSYNYPNVLIGQYYSKIINQSITESWANSNGNYENQSFESLLDNNEYCSNTSSLGYTHRQVESYRVNSMSNVLVRNIESVISQHQQIDTSVFHTIKQFVPNSVDARYGLAIDNHILARNKIPTIDFMRKYQNTNVIKQERILAQVNVRTPQIVANKSRINTKQGVEFIYKEQYNLKGNIKPHTYMQKKISSINNYVCGTYRFGIQEDYRSFSTSVQTLYAKLRAENTTALFTYMRDPVRNSWMQSGSVVTSSNLSQRKMIVDMNRQELTVFGTKLKIT